MVRSPGGSQSIRRSASENRVRGGSPARWRKEKFWHLIGQIDRFDGLNDVHSWRGIQAGRHAPRRCRGGMSLDARGCQLETMAALVIHFVSIYMSLNWEIEEISAKKQDRKHD